MSISADLVAFVFDELDPARRREIERLVRDDPDVAAELADVRRALGAVDEHASVDFTPFEAATLRRNLAAAMSEGVVDVGEGDAGEGTGLGRLYRAAVRRYSTSTAFRRVAVASIAVHVAAACLVAWVLVGPPSRRRKPVSFSHDVASLPPLVENDPSGEGNDDAVAETAIDALVSLPPFEDADVDNGIELPSVFASSDTTAARRTPPGDDVTVPPRSVGRSARFPTRRIAVRLEIVQDDARRVAQLRARLGELAEAAEQSVAQGLNWLATQAAPDGRFGDAPAQAGTEDHRDGVTAAVVLAFVQNGRRTDPADEQTRFLARSVAVLEERLRDGPVAADPKPVYSQALALRALTWQWALEFDEMSLGERRDRVALLRRGAERLEDWQQEDGGFGYGRAGSDRSGSGRERSDASCTLFATAALADLRLAGVRRTDDVVARAGAYLAGLRDERGGIGYTAAGDRPDDLALTANALAYAPELGLEQDAAAALDAVAAAAVRGTDLPDALLDMGAVAALVRHRRPVAQALGSLLARQRGDGRFPSATDRHCRLGGDELTTAMAVLTVTRVLMP